MSLGANGLVSWPTIVADVGLHSIRLRAQKGSKKGTQEWSLRVFPATGTHFGSGPVSGSGAGRPSSQRITVSQGASESNPIPTRSMHPNCQPAPGLSRRFGRPPSGEHRISQRTASDTSGESGGARLVVWAWPSLLGEPSALGFWWFNDEGLVVAQPRITVGNRAELQQAIEAFVLRIQPHRFPLCGEIDVGRPSAETFGFGSDGTSSASAEVLAMRLMDEVKQPKRSQSRVTYPSPGASVSSSSPVINAAI